MPNKHSASLMAAMARGEMWALHTVRSTEVMGSPVTPTAPHPQQQQQQPGKGGREAREDSEEKAERIDK
ncbi:hypothetical protein LTR02_011421 [Friedmanniomyces endolithicus]|nr:hypothetical protein LTR59_016617 [Friedmanniomyces endolithicus]KAK0773377.1 hypothetical protein LTR38_016585 [Friedmanniomyces endolithicus]KAK0778293.1 hypothetical protein LTR75_015691 [Friedmanniomyces endolithicus]KAK0822975.1 hypothetical protein LTR03_018033 [Friedmanniomyces endolithicus]KAK0845991.1 hypothetical protein LTS02_015085 [Friedmanniomyces endolithicus]